MLRIIIFIFAAITLLGCSDSSSLCSKLEYSTIAPGQTYSEVAQLIGSEGKILPAPFTNGDDIAYEWTGNDPDNSMVIVVFNNQRVLYKVCTKASELQ